MGEGLYDLDMGGVEKLDFNLRAGNDAIYLQPGLAEIQFIEVAGGSGNDSIIASGLAIDMSIDGGLGRDFIRSGDANDSIDGGEGNDIILGGFGDDYIVGGEGNDSIFGQDGDDNIEGNEGDDLIFGGAGNDFLDGGIGWDFIVGGPRR